MSSSRPGPVRSSRPTTGRSAVVAVALVVLVAVAILAAIALGSPRSGPPSLAGPLSASPGAEGSEAAAPASAGASSLAPSASSAPTTRPTAKPTARPTPRPTPRPTQNPSTKPAIVSYQIPSSADCGGNTNPVDVQITWIVERATGVTISIDGPGIYASYNGATGLATVPFACGAGDTKHTYTLTTAGGTGPAAHVTKTVKRSG